MIKMIGMIEAPIGMVEAPSWIRLDGDAWLLLAAVAVPLMLAFAVIVTSSRRWRASALSVAAVPAFAVAVVAHDGAAMIFDQGRLEVGLLIDGPRATLLGVVALLWCLAGAYAATSMRADPEFRRFAIAWLLSLAGCVGVFIAADLAVFYLFFALVSLAAFVLVMHDGTERARRASMVYLALAVLGEALLLLGFVLLAAGSPGDSLMISTVVAALPEARLANQTIAFIIIGFGIKVGLVPLHGWLPLAHPAAPMPASAVLSGAIIKTGVIGLILFLPFGAEFHGGVGAGGEGWGVRLLAIGLLTALYGAAVGLTQANPKTILAYSSMSQMGLVVALLGAALRAESAEATSVAIFVAAHHALVKGALFIGIGVVAVTVARNRTWVLTIMALLALSLPGLPLTGGGIAKLVSKPLLGDGWIGVAAAASAILSTLIMLHFVQRLTAGVSAPTVRTVRATTSRGLLLPWASLATCALTIPWILQMRSTDPIIGAVEPLGVKSLMETLWPIAVGASLYPIARRLVEQLPSVPEGDLVCIGERTWNTAEVGSALCERVDRPLNRWTTAGIALMITLLALAALVRLGHDQSRSGAILSTPPPDQPVEELMQAASGPPTCEWPPCVRRRDSPHLRIGLRHASPTSDWPLTNPVALSPTQQFFNGLLQSRRHLDTTRRSAIGARP